MRSQLIDRAKRSFRSVAKETDYEAYCTGSETMDCFYNVVLEGVQPASASDLLVYRSQVKEFLEAVNLHVLTFSERQPLKDAVNRQCLKKGI